MKLSGIPIYEYENGLYKQLVDASTYERAYHGETIVFQWNKLARVRESLQIAEVRQTRARGFMS
jgi:hypothetical protein